MKGRVFVTGATGFVGANLVRLLLQENYQVRALVRKNADLTNVKNLDIELVEGSLNDENLYNKMIGCDYLFHVAALYSLWSKDKELLYQTNVLGTKKMFFTPLEKQI